MLLDFPDKAFFNTRRKETQFATESRLEGETASVEEIHFTAGNPFAAKLSFTYMVDPLIIDSSHNSS